MRIVTVSLAVLTMVAQLSCRKTAEVRTFNAEQIADRTRPATVEIVTQLEVTVEFHELTLNKDKLGSALRQRLGGGVSSAQQGIEAGLDVLLGDPGSFLEQADTTRTVTKTISSIGTGLVITPNGYIVTNAHVVEPEEEELKEAVVSSISDVAGKDVEDLRSLVAQLTPGRSPTEEAEERFKIAVARLYARGSRIANLRRSVDAVMGSTGSGSDSKAKRMPCEVKKPGTPIPGKDVEILKMEGDDFPTMPLAANLSEGGVRMGTDLFVLGYPGDVALNPNFSLPTRLQPSLTTGIVSGIKDMTGGWKVIQTNAAINPGNSGGPVLNNKGEVVGLATFTLRGQDGTVPQGVGFVVSVDLVNEFLGELNVRPSPSHFTGRYLEALSAWEDHRTTRARQLFRDLSYSYPESPAVAGFLKELDNGDPAPHTVAPPDSPKPEKAGSSSVGPHAQRNPAVILLVIGGLLALVVVIVVLANR
jgi:serine protease Do